MVYITTSIQVQGNYLFRITWNSEHVMPVSFKNQTSSHANFFRNIYLHASLCFEAKIYICMHLDKSFYQMLKCGTKENHHCLIQI